MSANGIEGKVAISAGGAKNLGGLIARDLAAHGAKAAAIHYNSASAEAEAEATVAAVRAEAAAVSGTYDGFNLDVIRERSFLYSYDCMKS